MQETDKQLDNTFQYWVHLFLGVAFSSQRQRKVFPSNARPCWHFSTSAAPGGHVCGHKMSLLLQDLA